MDEDMEGRHWRALHWAGWSTGGLVGEIDTEGRRRGVDRRVTKRERDAYHGHLRAASTPGLQAWGQSNKKSGQLKTLD